MFGAINCDDATYFLKFRVCSRLTPEYSNSSPNVVACDRLVKHCLKLRGRNLLISAAGCDHRHTIAIVAAKTTRINYVYLDFIDIGWNGSGRQHKQLAD